MLNILLQGLSDDVEVAKLTRERDEMRALLDKFERHMAEVISEIIKYSEVYNSLNENSSVKKTKQNKKKLKMKKKCK